MKFVKSILVGLFTCICWFIIYSCSCSTNNYDDRVFYRVVKFEVSDTIKHSHVNATRTTYTGKTYVYNMDIVNNEGDTINEKFVSDEVIRFIPGDSVYLRYHMWRIKR